MSFFLDNFTDIKIGADKSPVDKNSKEYLQIGPKFLHNFQFLTLKNQNKW